MDEELKYQITFKLDTLEREVEALNKDNLKLRQRIKTLEDVIRQGNVAMETFLQVFRVDS